jgi:Family of unknown function (DUF6153)
MLAGRKATATTTGRYREGVPSTALGAQVTGARQLLFVLGLLLSVMLMHGFTADHDMPMASATAMATPNAVGHIASGQVDDPLVASQADVASGILEQSMGTMCVAILVGGLLLPLIAAWRLKKRTAYSLSSSTVLRSSMARTAESRWPAAPSLTRLCVSRT